MGIMLQFLVCQISTELRSWSNADCMMEYKSLIHLHVYDTSCRNMHDSENKHSGGVSYNACSAFVWQCKASNSDVTSPVCLAS